MATGKCRHCGYEPVAYDADICPNCARWHPNPGVVSKYAGISTWIGILLGSGAGAIWGASVGGIITVIIQSLMGALVGCMVGLVSGLTIGVTAWLCGKR